VFEIVRSRRPRRGRREVRIRSSGSSLFALTCASPPPDADARRRRVAHEHDVGGAKSVAAPTAPIRLRRRQHRDRVARLTPRSRRVVAVAKSPRWQHLRSCSALATLRITTSVPSARAPGSAPMPASNRPPACSPRRGSRDAAVLARAGQAARQKKQSRREDERPPPVPTARARTSRDRHHHPRTRARAGPARGQGGAAVEKCSPSRNPAW